MRYKKLLIILLFSCLFLCNCVKGDNKDVMSEKKSVKKVESIAAPEVTVTTSKQESDYEKATSKFRVSPKIPNKLKGYRYVDSNYTKGVLTVFFEKGNNLITVKQGSLKYKKTVNFHVSMKSQYKKNNIEVFGWLKDNCSFATYKSKDFALSADFGFGITYKEVYEFMNLLVENLV